MRICGEFMSLVSVVIPTKNSARTIEKCLESVVNQSHKNLEIIIVDANSIDDTVVISQDFKVQIITAKVERTTAKNLAAKKSNGEYILYIDSDMILQSSVIADCLKVMKDPKVGGVVIPEKTIGSGFWTKVRAFERNFYFGTKIESARFFRTRDVRSAGGFDEEIITYEESTLPQKIEKMGLRTDVRISSLILHDEGKLNLRKWLEKKHYYSNTSEIYRQKYKNYAEYHLSLAYRIRIYLQRGNWTNLLKRPDLTLGLLTLKSLEFFSSKRRKDSNI